MRKPEIRLGDICNGCYQGFVDIPGYWDTFMSPFYQCPTCQKNFNRIDYKEFWNKVKGKTK